MPPRTYGKKKATTASSSSSTNIIFGISSSKKELIEKAITEAQGSNQTNKAVANSKDSSFRLEVLTDHDVDDLIGLSRLSLHPATITAVEAKENEDASSIGDQDPSFVDPILKCLDEIFSKEQFEFCNSTWAQLLPAKNCVVIKIAEATFAEVYRITTPKGSSIVKIMPLIIPTDLDSYARPNASKVEDVITELQIMDELTVIPGFVKFKQAWIVKGQHSRKFVEAWERWQLKTEEISEFAHPATYGPNATFLAIELDDAGEVLEDAVIDTWDKFWDVFLGVVTALATAEEVNQFEHRDLHENNICVLTNEIPFRKKFPNSDYGRSGLTVTLIDYGLSRAKLTRKFLEDESSEEVVAFKDLELDLEVFQGPKGQMQFETYRQMRSWLYNGSTKKMPVKFHKDSTLMKQAGKSWEEYTPYSNVLWLSYIFYYLYQQYTDCKVNPIPITAATPSLITTPVAPQTRSNRRGILKSSNLSNKTGPSLCNSSITSSLAEELDVDLETYELRRLTEGLKNMFCPSMSHERGGFRTAGDVYMYCVEKGWISDGMIVTPAVPKMNHEVDHVAPNTSELPTNTRTRSRGGTKSRGRGVGRVRGKKANFSGEED